jgi:hypothetical protein
MLACPLSDCADVASRAASSNHQHVRRTLDDSGGSSSTDAPSTPVRQKVQCGQTTSQV